MGGGGGAAAPSLRCFGTLCLLLVASGLVLAARGAAGGPPQRVSSAALAPHIHARTTCRSRWPPLLEPGEQAGGLLLLLRLRGGGRRRVARPATRMKLGHLSKVVEKRASNIARRQKKEAQDNDHYGKADGVWEVLLMFQKHLTRTHGRYEYYTRTRVHTCTYTSITRLIGWSGDKSRRA